MKVAWLVAVIALAGCSSKKRAPAPAPETPEPTEVASAAPVAAQPAPRPASPLPQVALAASDFPVECKAYAELVDRLKSCDALGSARDGMTRAYNELRAGWPDVPPPQRATVAAQCKSQADSLRNAVAATCKW